jgi:hypothetical protein
VIRTSVIRIPLAEASFLRRLLHSCLIEYNQSIH